MLDYAAVCSSHLVSQHGLSMNRAHPIWVPEFGWSEPGQGHVGCAPSGPNSLVIAAAPAVPIVQLAGNLRRAVVVNETPHHINYVRDELGQG
jgi:hypothetical protein